MKKISAVAFFCLLNILGFSQGAGDTIQARIILIGDAGEFNSEGKHPVVAAVKKHMKLDSKTTIVYLGDNLYKAGLPDALSNKYNEARAVLDTQANIASGTDAKVYFIPGNHDWDEYGSGGWDAVRRQQYYINLLGNNNVNFYPEDGCPGPVLRNLSDDVVLIMMDSQWWLHEYDKPGIESDCPFKTKLEFLNELEDMLARNSKKLVILAMHHPFKSNGIHGGYFPFKTYIFPLTDLKKNLYIPFPGIGLIYPIVRGVFGTPQDLKHPNYVNMINEVQDVVRSHPNTIFVAGHEHNQQLIRDSGYYYIVSGAGAKESRVSKAKNSLFASDTTGFTVLEISKNKNVKAAFYNVYDEKVKNAYDNSLMNFSDLGEVSNEDSIRIVYVPYNADSITIAANPNYANASSVKKFFNGKNYRKEWATSVKMKVFYLKKMGMTIESLGGGKQTRTLTLKDKKGKQWLLRTVDKDVEKLLPVNFRGSAAEDYLQDFVSTAHPYASLMVPVLAKAADIIAANPKLYFVPNDDALGLYRTLFANKVVTIEEKEPTPDGGNTKSTAKTINEMIEDNEHHVDQEVVLRARLLDILIGDWDRHFDQWRFGKTDTGKGKLYYPIPRDRDEAFSYSDGIVLKLLAANSMPYLRGFQPRIQDAKWISYWAKDFDRLFLNNLDETVWRKTIEDFQKSVSDEIIHKAVMNLPREVYAIRGPWIEERLKSRRNLLMQEGMQYYKFLSKDVNISGSNQKEYFKVSQADGQLQVRVYKRKRAVDSVSVMYDRKFDEKITSEIRFYGLGKDDFFEVDDDVSSKIKLRMIGGRGDDTFNIKGKIKNILYDFNLEDNFVEQGNNSKYELSDKVEVHHYDNTGYHYNRFYFPVITMGYNQEDGVLGGIGFTKRRYGFRKYPYSSEQVFSSLYAFATGSYNLKYKGDFINVFGETGLQIKTNLVKPVLNNFFGLGNVTPYDKELKPEFYRVRYNFIESEALITNRLGRNKLLVGAGPYLYHYWNNPADNAGKILNRPSFIGLDSMSIYQRKTYAGLKALAIISTLNNDLFPTRGVYWNTQVSALAALKNGKPLTSFISDLTLYTSLRDPARLVTVVKIGGGHIFSKNFEYFQALNLGQNNVLRGFRKNRFSGRSLAYLSFEARVKLLDTKSYILPGAFGVLGFTDVGKVWIRNETSKRWHNSVGGGFYYAAYNTVLLSATVGFSREETLLNFTVGSKFNLNF